MAFTPTTKTNEALQAALKAASAAGNPDIRPAHLLVALLEQEDGIAAPLLTSAGVEPGGTLTRARELVAGYPSASGGNMANPQFNRDALNALTSAEELAGELGDEYVSTEVLLIGIATGDSDAARMLQDSGATPDALKAALTSVRGNRTVTTENPEEQWQALEKYATDLTARAREGKIDPVIGRDADLYGLRGSLEFVGRIRGMVTFDGAEALIERMHVDVDEALEMLGEPPRPAADGDWGIRPPAW